MTVSTALVDTGALVALARRTDQYHQQALETARRFLGRGGRLVGTALVLGETHNHLLRAMGPERARAVTAALLRDASYEWLDATVPLIREALSRWLERYEDQAFSLTDAVSFEVMRRERLTTAFAFDQDFVTAGFDLLR